MRLFSSEASIQQVSRFQRLLESTRAVPWEASLPDWRYTYIGPQIVELLGYSVEEWLQPDFWIKHIHPDDCDWAPDYCQQATERLEDHEFEYRMLAADGRIVWFRDIVSVIVEDGKAVGLHGFMVDVTDRKQTEFVMQTLAATSSSVGIDEFYRTCVKSLARVYNSQYAFIGLLEEGGLDVRTVAVWAGDDFTENFEYNLNSTPCQDILNQEKELIPKDAAKLYPEDELLGVMGVESYFGAPLVSSEGKTIGLVSVMDTTPMLLTKHTEPILGIFATRIAVETERQMVINRLSYSQNALTQAQHIANIGSFEWDHRLNRVTWSNEAMTILRWQGRKNITTDLQDYYELIDEKQRDQFNELLHQLINSKKAFSHEHRLNISETCCYIDFRAHYYYDNLRQRELLIGTIHDVTERYEQEQALQKMASYDSLTGLPNRWLLNQKVFESIVHSKDNGGNFCLALLDLDGFKEVNDTLGHFAGDQLLRQLKPRIESVLRPTDYIARLGGDEFAIIFKPISNIDDAIQLAEQLRTTISQPFTIEKASIQVGASVGLCTYPEHGNEVSELLRHADVAMYQAKKDMSGHAVYDADRDPYGPRRLALINDIRSAILDEQLHLHYQPKIDTQSGALIGVEALVRWQHPVHGSVPPSEFIPFCEVSDLIHELTEYVLHKALADSRKWHAHGYKVKVAVNIAARNLMNISLPEMVQMALEAQHADPKMLQLEITENDLMHDPERAKSSIQVLNDMGIGLSIDDFGTGYSSLAYLKHLRVDELKIDQSFVRDMLKDENDAVIVKSIIDLGSSLGLQVTAEGVEDASTLKQLLDYGCTLAQGYHIARPMSARDLFDWMGHYRQQRD